MTGRLAAGPVIAASFIALGVGTFLSGSALANGGQHLAGANAPVDPGATDPLDIRAQNSPSLVRNPANPSNLAVANRIDTPSFSCALFVSFDAGRRWAETPIAFPSGEEQPPRCFAPDIAFGPDGTLYVSFVTLAGIGNVPNAVWVSSSGDGGRTLSPPRRAAGPLAFQVGLTADPDVAGRLWLTWLQATETATLAFPTPGNPILTARSDDGGVTWGESVTVNALSRGRVVAPTTAAASGGRLWTLYLDLGDDSLDYAGAHGGSAGPPYSGTWSLVLARSSDAGKTWLESVVEPAVVPTERFVVFTPPSPSLAIDPARGAVYVGYQDGRLGDADVWVWASHDGGSVFAPTRVNDTRARDGSAQYRPALAVAGDGRLDVVYYDQRRDPGGAFIDVSFQSSRDGGRTFGERLRLSDRSFDSGIGFTRENAIPDQGSRLGVLSDNGGALAVWTDTRAGTRLSNKQDLVQMAVEVSKRSPWRQPLRVGGALVAAAGLAGGLGLALRRMYRRGRPVAGRPHP